MIESREIHIRHIKKVSMKISQFSHAVDFYGNCYFDCIKKMYAIDHNTYCEKSMVHTFTRNVMV